MTPKGIVQAAGHILLDFDGPVCAVFGGTSDREVANMLRAELAANGVAYPDSVARTRDPFTILRFASHVDALVAKRVELRFRACESDAVEQAPATPGAEGFLRHASEAGQLITIVSNNSTVAVWRYLELRNLVSRVHGVSARDDAVTDRLKPSPFLLRQAMTTTNTRPEDCVMIGDSVTDIEAARAAGTRVIAYANKPGKRDRFAALGADSVITSMTELWTPTSKGEVDHGG